MVQYSMVPISERAVQKPAYAVIYQWGIHANPTFGMTKENPETKSDKNGGIS